MKKILRYNKTNLCGIQSAIFAFAAIGNMWIGGDSTKVWFLLFAAGVLGGIQGILDELRKPKDTNKLERV